MNPITLSTLFIIVDNTEMPPRPILAIDGANDIWMVVHGQEEAEYEAARQKKMYDLDAAVAMSMIEFLTLSTPTT
jgi:hypothetical protein